MGLLKYFLLLTSVFAITANAAYFPTTTAVQSIPANLKLQAWAFDGAGNAITSSGGALSCSSAQSGSWSIGINNFPATQPISAVSLPLPSGAATSAGLTTINTTLGSPMQNSGGSVQANAGTNLNTSALALESGGHLASLDSHLPAQGQALAAASLPVVLTAAQITTLTPLSSISVSNFPATQPISAASLPLPSGAATSALQSTINTTLGSPMQNSGGSVTANAGTNLNTSLLALDTSVNGLLLAQGSATSTQKGTLMMGAVTTAAPSYTTAQTSPFSLTLAGNVRVDGSSVTQPISAASLPLPTGAATSANQTNGSEKAQIVDGSGNVVGPVTILSAVNYMPVVMASTATPGSAAVDAITTGM